MVKVIKMIKNDPITGVEYGAVEVPETPIEIKIASERFQKTRTASTKKIRNERIKKK